MVLGIEKIRGLAFRLAMFPTMDSSHTNVLLVLFFFLTLMFLYFYIPCYVRKKTERFWNGVKDYQVSPLILQIIYTFDYIWAISKLCSCRKLVVMPMISFPRHANGCVQLRHDWHRSHLSFTFITNLFLVKPFLTFIVCVLTLNNLSN